MLRQGGYEVRILPSAGGRLASWTRNPGSVPHDLQRPLGVSGYEPHDWPKEGEFPMIPFANRLPFGTVRAGRLCARPDIGLQGFVLHGFAHRQEWSVSAMSEDSIDMALMHSGDTHGWPWPWAAKQRITLGAYGLRVEFEVTNLANVAAPLALGWHPYFAVGADIRAEDLRFAADKCYHLDGAGAAVLDDGRPASFSMTPGATNAYSDWSGYLELRCNDDLTMSIRCEGAQHLVIHRPSVGEYLCIEPATELPGWMGKDDYSAHRLVAPGESRRLSITCCVTKPFRS